MNNFRTENPPSLLKSVKLTVFWRFLHGACEPVHTFVRKEKKMQYANYFANVGAIVKNICSPLS
jgi:hypothetical protein